MADDRLRRQQILEALYRAYRENGLYRAVVSRRELAEGLGLAPVELERNLDYLLDRGLVNLHRLEELVSITTAGIDRLESGGSAESSPLTESLGKIERLLERILERLEQHGG